MSSSRSSIPRTLINASRWLGFSPSSSAVLKQDASMSKPHFFAVDREAFLARRHQATAEKLPGRADGLAVGDGHVLRVDLFPKRRPIQINLWRRDRRHAPLLAEPIVSVAERRRQLGPVRLLV